MSVNILIISQLQLTMLLAVEVTGRRLGLFFEIACLYFMFVMTSNLPYAHSSAKVHGCGEVAAGSDTAAYLLDGKVGEAARHGKFLSLGKRLTKKLGGRHAVVEDCERWFQPDGVHLPRAGYTKVYLATSFPLWLME